MCGAPLVVLVTRVGVPFSCIPLTVLQSGSSCYINLPCREEFISSPSCGCLLCSELFPHWSSWALRDLAPRFSRPPCGAASESSFHLTVLSIVWRDSCGLFMGARWGSGISHVGRVSVNGACVHVGVSTVYMHAQVSKVRVAGQFEGAKFVLFLAFLFCVALGRLTRVGINGRLRQKALYARGKPFRLAASRVRCMLIRVPALPNASPGLFVMASNK